MRCDGAKPGRLRRSVGRKILEDRTEHFEDAVHLPSLAHLHTFSVSCALIDDSDILKMLPPDSSNVQDIIIASRNISKTSLRLLLAMPKSLKTFRWWDRMWLCHKKPEEIACATISSAEIAQCLYQVKDSLEELHIDRFMDSVTCPRLGTGLAHPQCLLYLAGAASSFFL